MGSLAAVPQAGGAGPGVAPPGGAASRAVGGGGDLV